jgi:hypothetical protein
MLSLTNFIVIGRHQIGTLFFSKKKGVLSHSFLISAPDRKEGSYICERCRKKKGLQMCI